MCRIRPPDQQHRLVGWAHDQAHHLPQRGKTLTHQDLEHLPGTALLATNLEKSDYVERLCGTLDQLPAAFAGLDAGERRVSLSVRQRAQAHESSDVASARRRLSFNRRPRSHPL